MTETTSISPLIRERHVYAPAVPRRPNVATVMAQAAVGYIAGNFVVILIEIFLVPDINNRLAVLFVPLLPFLGGVVGGPAGAFIWAVGEIANRPLNKIYGTAIGVTVVALAWLYFAYPFPGPLERWFLEAVFLPGLGIGVVTGSRLRVWHELVRKGDALGKVLGSIAAFSGVVLRLTAVALFMVSFIALISILQSSYYQRVDRIWSLLAFSHCTAALVLVFARMKIELLLPLSVIVIVPIAVRLFVLPDLWELVRYGMMGYLALWAVFLLTRWRQTQAALSVLNEEFRYYLID